MEHFINNMRQITQFKTALILFFMLLFWASAYVGIRAGLKGYSPGALALLRYSVASLSMLFIYFQLHQFRKLPWRDVIYAMLLGVCGFAIYNVALNYGELTVTAGTASFIISQIPVLLTLFGITLAKEKLKWFGWLGTCISVLGVFLITTGEKEGIRFDVGILYVLIAVFTGAIYSALQKPILTRMHPIEFTTYAIWGGTLTLLIYLPQLIHEVPRANLNATYSAIYLGIFPAAIGYLLWSYVVQQMPISKAGSYLYLIPPMTIVIGWIWLREISTWLAIIGGLLALFGALLVKNGVYYKR